MENINNFSFFWRKHSDETKNKMSIAHKWQIPWSKWKHLSEEHRSKISKSNKWKKFSEEHRYKIKKNHANISWKNHPNWKWWISTEAYWLEFNEDLKEVIRNRDRRKCKLCYATELYNLEKLSVHHIDYNKKNNDPVNLISLCRHCHLKTNYNREHWTQYFINRMYE
jgi:hypothetical protein